MLDILFWLALGVLIGLLAGELRVLLIKSYLERIKETIDQAHIKNHNILQSERNLSIIEEKVIKEQNKLFSKVGNYFHKLKRM